MATRGRKRTHDEEVEEEELHREEEAKEEEDEEDEFDDDDEEQLVKTRTTSTDELFSPASKDKAKLLLKSAYRDRIFIVPGMLLVLVLKAQKIYF